MNFPTAAQEAIPDAFSPFDLANIVKGSFSIGSAIVGGGIKIIGKQGLTSLGNVTKPSAAQLGKMLGVTQQQFHKTIKADILKDFKPQFSKFGIKNQDVALDKAGNIVIFDTVKGGRLFPTNTPLSTFRP